MKIAIRADGGSNIGMGHIMRSLVLAKELAKSNEVFYVCRVDNPLSDKYKHGINKVKAEGFNLISVNEDNFIKELCLINAECLITDSYEVSEEYFNITKKFFDITGYIDDMNLYYFDVDFVINQNIGADEWLYKTNKETQLFLGTRYTMLRHEFRDIKHREIKEKVSNIMITVGGADPNGITNKICDFIKELKFSFHIVIGPSFMEENIKKLKVLSSLNKNINLYFNSNMIDIMKKADIAISACGSTLYELAACEVPTIGVIVAENQEKIAYKMCEKGLLYNLGWYSNLSKKKTLESIKFLSTLENREMMISKQNIINKSGVEILASKIINLQEVK